MTDLEVVFHYSKLNRHGFNALAGAIAADAELRDVPLHFPKDERELTHAIGQSLRRAARVVAGISFMTAQRTAVHALVSRLRKSYGSAPVLVAGGPHPTADPSGTLRAGFDCVVIGEGEATMLDLLKSMRRGERAPVPGSAARSPSGACELAPSRPLIDLDCYPPFSERDVKIGPIEITRGCSFACGFCQTSHLFGGKPRHRSIASIAEYVGIMTRRGMHDVRFVTPDAFAYGSPDGRRLNVPALAELLSTLRRVMGREGRMFFGSFPSEVRPEHVTPETVGLLVEHASNDNLLIGAQSGSQRMLDACRRGHSVDDVLRAGELTIRAGLKANVDFIIGLPGETDDDLDATLSLMRRLVEMGAKIHAHAFMPLPQSGFADQPPGRISPRARTLLRRLIPHGRAYGTWEAQESLSHGGREYRGAKEQSAV